MKRIKMFSILFFLIAVVIYGVYILREKLNQDLEAPVIQYETDTLTVSVNDTEQELLQDVTAMDKVDGDVSHSLVIENMSELTEDLSRIITYAAIDEAGNVGRIQRTLIYEDYEEPSFSLSEPLRFPMGNTIDLLARVHADSVLDGNLDDKIKYTMESVIDLKTTGTYKVEYRVADSAERTISLPLPVEIYNPVEERIKVILTEYLVYVPMNKKFAPEKYFVGSDIEGVLSIHSEVNTSKPGIYKVDYEVTSMNSVGKSRLIVVVTES